MPDSKEKQPRRLGDLADAVSLQDAARLLGVSVRTVYRIIARGFLTPFFLPHSGRPRITLDQIVRLRKQTDVSKAPARSPRLRMGRGSK